MFGGGSVAGGVGELYAKLEEGVVQVAQGAFGTRGCVEGDGREGAWHLRGAMTQ